MIRLYEELTPKQQDKLSHAWVKVVEGLEVYESVTGAQDLDDLIYEHIWAEVQWQKDHNNLNERS